MSLSRPLSRASILGLFVLTTLAWSDGILYNSGFQVGDLNGWTPFATANGTVGTTMPTVVPFTLNGVPADVAQFEVGQTSYANNDPEGGGIENSLLLPSGQMTLSADVSFYDASTFANVVPGEAILLMDNVPVAEYTAGELAPGQLVNQTLSYTFSGFGQPTTVAVEFVRPALAIEGVTPYEMVDDVEVFGSPIGGPFDPDPEPATWMMAGTALGLAAWWRRRQALRRAAAQPAES